MVEKISADEKKIIELVRSVKEHGYGIVTVRVQEGRTVLAEENKTHKIGGK